MNFARSLSLLSNSETFSSLGYEHHLEWSIDWIFSPLRERFLPVALGNTPASVAIHLEVAPGKLLCRVTTSGGRTLSQASLAKWDIPGFCHKTLYKFCRIKLFPLKEMMLRKSISFLSTEIYYVLMKSWVW